MSVIETLPPTTDDTGASAGPEPAVASSAEALMGRLFEALLGSLEVSTVYLGLKLGFYPELTQPRTAAEVSEATGVLPRYVREWLEQQAISGFLDVDDATDPEQRRFWLSDDQAAVLLHEDSPLYGGAMALLGGGCGAVLPRVLQAWRDGTGLSFGEYGDDVRIGQGMFNKGGYFGPLVEEWLPAMPEVQQLLARDGASALDVGCGVGWSTLALADAFPNLAVVGTDSDEASILDARANAADAGLGERLRFEVRLSDAEPRPSEHDVVFFFECLHDMAHPVAALRAAHTSLRPGGRVVVMDERAEETFGPNGTPTERLFGAASVIHCLPVGLSEPDSAGTGTLFRPDILRRYAGQAGFSSVEIAPIEHEMMRFYVLEP